MKTNRTLFAVTGAALLGLGLGIYRLSAGAAAPPTLLYILLSAGMAFCLGCGLVFGRKSAPETFERTDLFKTAVVLAGILTLGGALLRLAMAAPDMLAICTSALLTIAGFGMILGLKETDSQLPHVMVSVPVFACGLYLLVIYKAHVAAGPNIHRYAFEILTVLFLTAALYSIAAMRFTNRSRSPFITTTVLGAILLTVCTAISTLLGAFLFSMADLLICCGLALYCGAWYLNPPLKYVVPEDEDADEENNDDEDLSEIIVPETEAE